MVACLLVTGGIEPNSAVVRLSLARGDTIPETPEQRRWIDGYVATSAGI